MSDRLPIALHLTQELLPLTGAGSSSNTPPNARAQGSGSGYGPPLSPQGTPMSRLVAATLYTQPASASAAATPGSSLSPSDDVASSSYASSSRTEYDLVAVPLTNRNWQERWERMCTITSSQTELDLGRPQHSDSVLERIDRLDAEAWRSGGGFRRNEVNLTRSEEAGNLIVFASDWLELDSPVEGIRFDSELALRQEITYASYLSLTNIIIPPPRLENREYLADYARAINSALASSWHIHISIRVPVSVLPPAHSGGRPVNPVVTGSATPAEDHCATWNMWNTIRGLCAYAPRLTLTLDLTNPLPPATSLGRWAAEPFRHLLLPSTTFIPNAKGYPVLSKSMQAFLRSIVKFNPTVILSGTHRGVHAMGGPLAYAQYVRHLHRKAAPLDPVEQYAQGYMDHLQQPLQPLMDNLEGETYEGFEKDPVKYRQYEEAVFRALMDRPEAIPVTIFVAGAGRGPLVAGCIRAAERARRKILLTAVEKNPSAFVVLQERGALEWGSAVKLIFSDMRGFHPREKADIIVSELLGSFGDNELSPECLDGVMRCLKPDGISIPSSYTSYLAPITTSRLHAEVTVPVAAGSTSVVDSKPAEQPYVVMFSAFHILSASGGRLGTDRIQECWSFDHPKPDVVVDDAGLPLTNHHNARSAHLTFHIPQAGVCHGFAGYFEAVLYHDVGLSIHPERAAGDMLSWFPIFFPLMDPIYLPAQSELDVQMWRLTDGVKRKVWFEWACSAYLSASSLLFTPSPPTSATSFTSNHQNRSQDPRGTWMPMPSPMIDAFQSAPSPMIGHSLPGDRRDSGRMQGIDEEVYGNGQRPTSGVTTTESRILISQSKLHNPGGRTSFIGL